MIDEQPGVSSAVRHFGALQPSCAIELITVSGCAMGISVKEATAAAHHGPQLWSSPTKVTNPHFPRVPVGGPGSWRLITPSLFQKAAWRAGY